MNERRRLPRRWGAIAATAALLGGLLLVNAAATREILHARTEARRMAHHELVLRLEREAQSLRAELADLRTDLTALAESPPLEELPSRIGSADPLVRRWAQRDAEGSLLLFLQARPALQYLRLDLGGGAAPVLIGRIDGVPQALDASHPAPSAGAHSVTMRAALPGTLAAELRSWVDPRLVLRRDEGAELETLALEEQAPAETAAGLVAAVPIQDERWEPAIDLWLVARRSDSLTQRSVESLAGSYRRTVIWNLVVILAVSAAVALALAQMRRRVRAEAAADHEREVRELERSLLHSERLATVGRFAAGVAHEVNNPLEGMGNYLSLLAGDLASGDAVKASERLPKVREGLDRAAAIVRRVLTFSDPARSPKEVCDLGGSVREAVDFLRPRFPGIALEVTVPPSTHVLGNRVALSQLFLNILLNACEGQDEGGEVTATVAEYDTTVVATIEDRGPGLTDEALDHLFEPFYSGRGSSGLGLSVCHGIVSDHGGEIRAANRANGGARFEVRLPRASRAQDGAG